MRFRDGRCRRCERPAGIARRAAAEVSFYENHARKKKKKKVVAIFNVYVYIFFMLCARSRRQNAVVCSRVGALWTAAFREGGGEPQRSAV